MGWLLTTIGVALIVLALRDMFETLFDPDGQGRLANAVTNGVWAIVRRGSGPPATYAGPVAYAAVILLWVTLLLFGWAAVYWPRMPEHFAFDPGLDPGSRSALVDALYLSLVSLTTLGYGDLTPESGWLRLFAPMQALTGFLLLSAGITWILHIYQELATRRALAHLASLLRESVDSREIDLGDVAPDSIQSLLADLTARVVQITGGYKQFPITHAFRSEDRRESVELACLFLLDLANEMSSDCHPPGVRLRARMLNGALADLASIVGPRLRLVTGQGTTHEVFTVLAAEHRRAVGLREE
jgi:hypothetical protein